MKPLTVEIPPHIVAEIRRFHPALKQAVKHALQAIRADPELGTPLQRELEGYRKYRVRRFRIVYAVDRKRRVVQVMAVGHRQSIYEELAEDLSRRERSRR